MEPAANQGSAIMKVVARIYWRWSPTVRFLMLMFVLVLAIPQLADHAWPNALVPRLPFVLLGVVVFMLGEMWHRRRRPRQEASS